MLIRRRVRGKKQDSVIAGVEFRLDTRPVAAGDAR
jgi:hypothetical protein